MATKLSLPLITDQEEKYLLTLSDMFSTVPPPAVLACLRKNNGSMEEAVTELLSISRQPPTPLDAPKPSAPSIPGTNMESVGTTSTLTRMQQELNKVYESSLALMEEKLKEQALEIRRLTNLLAERDVKINELRSELNRHSQDTDNYRKLLEIHQITGELATDVKRQVDSVFDQVQSKNFDVATFRHMASLVKQEIAYAFLKDLQENQVAPQQPTLQQPSASQTSNPLPYWQSPVPFSAPPPNTQHLTQYQSAPTNPQPAFQFFPVPSAPTLDGPKFHNVTTTGQ